MEEQGTGNEVHKAAVLRNIRGLVTLLLSRLGAAVEGIEALVAALRAKDADRALAIIESLHKVWTEAYLAITQLEQLSGCYESNVRQAFAQTQQRARTPLVLAWSIVSRLPNERHREEHS